MLSFVDDKLEKRVDQFEVCPKISHTRVLVKWLALGFPSS